MQIDTTNILFVCGRGLRRAGQGHRNAPKGGRYRFRGRGAEPRCGGVGETLKAVEPRISMKFGLIPEFVGRLPVVATLQELDEKP